MVVWTRFFHLANGICVYIWKIEFKKKGGGKGGGCFEVNIGE